MLDTVLGEENMVIGMLLHIPAYDRAAAWGRQDSLAPVQQLPGRFALPSSPYHSRGSFKSGQDFLGNLRESGTWQHGLLPFPCLRALGLDWMGTGCAHCKCTGSLSTLLIIHIFSPVQLTPSPVSEEEVPRTGPFSTSTNMLGFDCGNWQVAWLKLLNSLESFPQIF